MFLHQERLECLGIVVPKYSILSIRLRIGRGMWMLGIEEGEINGVFQLLSSLGFIAIADGLLWLVAQGMCAPTEWLLLNLIAFKSDQASSPIANEN